MYNFPPIGDIRQRIIDPRDRCKLFRQELQSIQQDMGDGGGDSDYFRDVVRQLKAVINDTEIDIAEADRRELKDRQKAGALLQKRTIAGALPVIPGWPINTGISARTAGTAHPDQSTSSRLARDVGRNTTVGGTATFQRTVSSGADLGSMPDSKAGPATEGNLDASRRRPPLFTGSIAIAAPKNVWRLTSARRKVAEKEPAEQRTTERSRSLGGLTAPTSAGRPYTVVDAQASQMFAAARRGPGRGATGPSSVGTCLGMPRTSSCWSTVVGSGSARGTAGPFGINEGFGAPISDMDGFDVPMSAMPGAGGPLGAGGSSSVEPAFVTPGLNSYWGSATPASVKSRSIESNPSRYWGVGASGAPSRGTTGEGSGLSGPEPAPAIARSGGNLAVSTQAAAGSQAAGPSSGGSRRIVTRPGRQWGVEGERLSRKSSAQIKEGTTKKKKKVATKRQAPALLSGKDGRSDQRRAAVDSDPEGGAALPPSGAMGPVPRQSTGQRGAAASTGAGKEAAGPTAEQEDSESEMYWTDYPFSY